jgi:hypothetical protein
MVDNSAYVDVASFTQNASYNNILKTRTPYAELLSLRYEGIGFHIKVINVNISI